MTPLLHGLVWGVVISSVLLTVAVLSIWFERKFSGRMQSRLGPTLVGPAGLLQPLADALKLLQKESIVPADADKWLFRLAPPLTVLFALGTAAVIPFSPTVTTWRRISFGSKTRPFSFSSPKRSGLPCSTSSCMCFFTSFSVMCSNAPSL